MGSPTPGAGPKPGAVPTTEAAPSHARREARRGLAVALVMLLLLVVWRLLADRWPGA